MFQISGSFNFFFLIWQVPYSYSNKQSLWFAIPLRQLSEIIFLKNCNMLMMLRIFTNKVWCSCHLLLMSYLVLILAVLPPRLKVLQLWVPSFQDEDSNGISQQVSFLHKQAPWEESKTLLDLPTENWPAAPRGRPLDVFRSLVPSRQAWSQNIPSLSCFNSLLLLHHL